MSKMSELAIEARNLEMDNLQCEIDALKACLNDAVKELLQATGEDSEESDVKEWIETWFDAMNEHATQYDHIGR